MPWPIPQPYPASDLSHSIAFHSVGTSVPLTAYKTDSAYSTCLELASRMEDVAQYHIAWHLSQAAELSRAQSS